VSDAEAMPGDVTREELERDVREIEEVIADLKASGEYETLATEAADAEANQLGNALARAHELTDAEVNAILASAEEAEPISDEALRREVRQALDRVHGANTQESRG
jgi:hypothetical protein